MKVVLFESGQVGFVGFGVLEEDVEDADETIEEVDEMWTEVASVVATEEDD